jgi:hypothetical protein
MANEFKVRKGLVINGSGSALLEAQGSVGQLSTITDSLSGSLFSINDISGIPVLEAFSDATVKIGAFGVEAIKVSGSFATITGSLLGTASFALSASNALSSSYALSSSFAINATTASYAVTASQALTASFLAGFIPTFPFTGSAIITGSTQILGLLTVTGSVDLSYFAAGGAVVWAAGGAMSVARYCLSGVGTTTAALAFGGNSAPVPNLSCTEKYNGSSWSAGNAMNGGRSSLAGAGIQNSALAFGGSNPTATEAYNGTSWAGGGNLITGRRCLAGAGASSTSALAFSGETPTKVDCTEAYNGSSWAARGAIILARVNLAGAGTQNAALAFGGCTAGFVTVACTEAYNGTSWSSGGAMSVARYRLAGGGTQNSALAFGGGSFGVTCTEAYNGTSWSVRSAMIVGRNFLGGGGASSVAAIAFGGNFPMVSCTEIFSDQLRSTFNYSNTTGQISATGSLFGTASFALNVIPITSKTIVIGNNNYIQPYDTGSFVSWRVPYPITASSITAFSTSSLGPTSGSQVNVNKNNSLLLAVPLAVTTSTWVSSSTLQNQNFNIGDVLGFNFLTLTGSLTQIVIQVDFIK